MNKRSFLWLGLAAIVARLAFLNSTPLWYDETFTVLVARLPLAQLIQATMYDTHPPLYYLIISLLFHLPFDQALIIRLFSVVCSLVSLWVMWLVTSEFTQVMPIRIMALFLMALMPVEVYYGQEGRMYSLVQLLLLAQILFLLRRKWLWLGLTTATLLYVHNYGTFYTALIYLVGMGRELITVRPIYRAGVDPKIEAGPLVSGGLAVAAWLPWFIVSTIHQMQTVAAGYWIQSISLGSTLYAMFQIVMTTSYPSAVVPVAVLAMGMLLAAAMIDGIQRKHYSLLVLAFGPVLLAVAVSLAWKPILLFRGLIGMLPAVYLLASELVYSNRRAWVLPVVLVPVMFYSLVSITNNNARGTAKGTIQLESPALPAVMVHLNDTTLLPYMVYRPGVTHYLLDAGCPGDPGALHPKTREALGIQHITRSALAGIGPYYLVAQVGPLSYQCEENVMNELIAHAQAVSVQRVTLGINGVWYER